MPEKANSGEKPRSGKLPIVKHTKTSMYRILKANPLFLLDKNKLQDLGLKDVKLPLTISPFYNTITPSSDVPDNLNNAKSNISELEPSTGTKLFCASKKNVPSSDVTDNLNNTKSNISELEPSTNTKPSCASKKNVNLKSSNGNGTSSLKSTIRQDKVVVQQRSTGTTFYNQSTSRAPSHVLKTTKMNFKSTNRNQNEGGTSMAKRVKFVQRRSSSAETFNNKILKSPTKFQKIQSTENLSSFLDGNLTPMHETESNTFKTPVDYNRRKAIIHTPSSESRISKGYMLTPGHRFSTTDLQRRLNDWLKTTGKPIESCTHLKSFNVQNYIIHEENKENMEKFEDLRTNDHDEKLDVTSTKPASKQPDIEEVPKDYGIICRDALIELHKLILDGYQQEQCEAWLHRIRQKYAHIDEEAHYWECCAALEESKGNIASAVEFYKTAIVQGAEVEAVEESLDQLLRNFSLLKISTKPAENNDKRKKIVLDARNIFKSSIIKFAVQEKKMKRKPNGDAEVKVATITPVRRSARLSGAFVHNHRVRESLKEIGGDQEFKFENNKFLAARFAPN